MGDKKIIGRLPSRRGDGDPVPSGLVGSKIVSFGTYIDGDVNFEGGLVIDYETADGTVKRLELGFTELGMWVRE